MVWGTNPLSHLRCQLPLSGELASRSDDGEDSLPRSAALSQKAALHLPFPAATPPVKME